MMTNGQMDESIKKEAILSDVDPDVFGMLVKYAYKRLCGISDAYPASTPTPTTTTVSPPATFYCHKCNGNVKKGRHNSQQYPFCSDVCRASYLSLFQDATSGNAVYYDSGIYLYCVADGSAWTFRKDSKHDSMLCCSCTARGQGKTYPPYQDSLSQSYAGVSSCSPEFSAKKYGCTNTTHEALQEHIQRHLPKDGIVTLDNNPLLLHAKLYTLASKYMVLDLPQICLHKMLALLKVFKINNDSISVLIELILYVYENTSDDGDILAGTGDKMRDLLIRYVVDRAKDVMQYENFRSQAMLGAGGAPSADMMAVTYGKASS